MGHISAVSILRGEHVQWSRNWILPRLASHSHSLTLSLSLSVLFSPGISLFTSLFFLTPISTQINILLNFSAGEDCPCPEDIQDELNSFHDELRLHCGKRLRPPRCFSHHAVQGSHFTFLKLQPNPVSLTTAVVLNWWSLRTHIIPYYQVVTQVYSTTFRFILGV